MSTGLQPRWNLTEENTQCGSKSLKGERVGSVNLGTSTQSCLVDRSANFDIIEDV